SARFEIGEAQIFLYAGRFEEALRSAQRALALDPTYAISYCVEGEYNKHVGRYLEALKAFDQCAGPGGPAPSDRARVFVLTGRRSMAERIADSLKARWPAARAQGDTDFAAEIAATLVALDRKEEALDWVERSIGHTVDLVSRHQHVVFAVA